MSTYCNSIGHVERTLVGYFPGSPCPTGGIHVSAVYISGCGFKLLNVSGPSIPSDTPVRVCGCDS